MVFLGVYYTSLDFCGVGVGDYTLTYIQKNSHLLMVFVNVRDWI